MIYNNLFLLANCQMVQVTLSIRRCTASR